MYPFSSSAVVNLRVKDPQKNLQVAFPALPKEIRPASKVTVDVDVRDASGAPAAQAEVTVALVDEGIHSITDYKNPDPAGWVARSRRPRLPSRALLRQGGVRLREGAHRR